jgi:Uma2 family endonuclease
MKISVREAKLTKEQFTQLCQENRDFRFELTAQQELVIMPPAGSETGRRNSKLNLRVAAWAETDGTGVAFDSSAGFTFTERGDPFTRRLVDQAGTMGHDYTRTAHGVCAHLSRLRRGTTFTD